MNPTVPDERGYFGPYGGRFVPETLMPALGALEEAYRQSQADVSFQQELHELLVSYVGRPTMGEINTSGASKLSKK